MGLAGARKRQKISHDPNNTTWARDTNGFGHKILSQQGWTPGSYLGARNAAQSSHFSAASASHIRVALKDDTLGIGAKRVGETAENFGLGALVDIFGRLNGKEERQMQKEQQARADLGAKLYAEQRYGPARFVRGGFLVGDKIEKEAPGEIPSEISTATNKPSPHIASQKSTKTTTKKSTANSTDKEERRRRKEEHKKSISRHGGETKEERRQRKEERRARKLAKRAAKAASASQPEPLSEEKDLAEMAATAEQMPKAIIAKPAVRFGGSRQAVRQRYIQAKKMAGMNPQALREILMARS